MRVEQYPQSTTREPHSVVAVGVFDGVHVGHQSILERVLQRAEAIDGVSTVVTFDPHPKEVVSGEIVPLLTTVRERTRLLGEAGIDRTVVVSFDAAFSKLSPEAFVREVLVRRIGVTELVIGYDHGFGSGRRGDVALLRTLAPELGFGVHEMEARITDHTPVSSSTIREALVVRGDVQGVIEMLGRRYSLSGEVIKGDGRGRLIEYPTANLLTGVRRKLVPQRGVYAVMARIDNGSDWLGGMMNIGFRPTFDGAGLRLEVHLLDVDRALYGSTLQLEFVERIRDERKFEGVDALRAQLKEDEVRCRRALSISSAF